MPGENVCSYELGARAGYRFSVGSTITYELIYMGYPSAFLAPVLGYKDGLTILSTENEVRTYVSNGPYAKTKDIPDIIHKYGDFYANFGESYKFFKPSGLFSGVFEYVPPVGHR